ncbi:hypothetical protein V7S43_008742 [Phytophthora oleae]|uniref:Chromo domain-containing protein n=1 Tax=Phytophthora oleae TaxID=2107226 RepID=A0ABD3FG68_9STRA
MDELQEQAVYGEGEHLVEALLNYRLSPATHRWGVFVKWFGPDDIEASWEPAETTKQDVPVLFQAFIPENPMIAQHAAWPPRW